MYREFNRKYFGNKLPKDFVVAFEDLEYHLGVTKFYRSRPCYINLNLGLRYSNSLTAMTLLHEMVHVELPYRYNHGPRFHKRMLKLAKDGAFKPWW